MLRVISAFIPHGLVIKPWAFSTNSLYFTTQTEFSVFETDNKLVPVVNFHVDQYWKCFRNCGTVRNQTVDGWSI